jgi:hypothetical protein
MISSIDSSTLHIVREYLCLLHIRFVKGVSAKPDEVLTLKGSMCYCRDQRLTIDLTRYFKLS